MDELTSEDIARGRWVAIQGTRLAGVAMVVVGILGVEDVIPMPDMVGWILIVVGLLDTVLVPQLMSRQWRAPRE